LVNCNQWHLFTFHTLNTYCVPELNSCWLENIMPDFNSCSVPYWNISCVPSSRTIMPLTLTAVLSLTGTLIVSLTRKILFP
jgi:hypothetical protein